MNRTPILFLNVLVIAACGLVYELLAGTVASYVIGDSVTQFSLIIGLYLSALGVGAWLSRYLDRDLAARFVEIEIGVALIGGLSAPLLFFGFARLQWFQLFLFLVVFVIGVLVGLELPILMRILKEHLDFKELVQVEELEIDDIEPLRSELDSFVTGALPNPVRRRSAERPASNASQWLLVTAKGRIAQTDRDNPPRTRR